MYLGVKIGYDLCIHMPWFMYVRMHMVSLWSRITLPRFQIYIKRLIVTHLTYYYIKIFPLNGKNIRCLASQDKHQYFMAIPLLLISYHKRLCKHILNVWAVILHAIEWIPWGGRLIFLDDIHQCILSMRVQEHLTNIMPQWQCFAYVWSPYVILVENCEMNYPCLFSPGLSI